MDNTDPILLIASVALVAIFLAPLASRAISRVAADFSADLEPRERELSRIRSRRR